MIMLYICDEQRNEVRHGALAEATGLVACWCKRHPKDVDMLAEMLPQERVEWVAARVLEEYVK